VKATASTLTHDTQQRTVGPFVALADVCRALSRALEKRRQLALLAELEADDAPFPALGTTRHLDEDLF
jgi:hypothetical protein